MNELVGLAFIAGAFATLNPCGFAVLPAVLGRFVAEGSAGARRGLVVGAVLSLGVLSVFTVIGAVVALLGVLLAGTLEQILLYINLGLGTVLLGLGVLTLGGRSLGFGFTIRPAAQAEAGGGKTYYLFGLVYGLASLGCTLPIFLSVAGLAFSRGAVTSFAVLMAYGLGMGGVLTLAATAAGAGKEALLRRVRRLGAYMETLGALLLIAAGVYLVGYNLGYILGGQVRQAASAWVWAASLGGLGLAIGLWSKRTFLRSGPPEPRAPR